MTIKKQYMQLQFHVCIAHPLCACIDDSHVFRDMSVRIYKSYLCLRMYVYIYLTFWSIYI